MGAGAMETIARTICERLWLLAHAGLAAPCDGLDSDWWGPLGLRPTAGMSMM